MFFSFGLNSFLTFLTIELMLKQFEASVIFPVTMPLFNSKIKSLRNNELFFACIFELNLSSLSIFFCARDSIFLKIFRDTVWNSAY